MKTQKTSAERYFDFLKSVSQRQRGFTNMGKILKKSKLCNALSQVLREERLMERKSDGVWKWTGKTPTMEMASRLVTSVNDSIKKYAKPSNASKGKSYPSNDGIKNKNRASSSDILDLAKLRQERIDIMNRMNKIDAVLEVAAGM